MFIPLGPWTRTFDDLSKLISNRNVTDFYPSMKGAQFAQ